MVKVDIIVVTYNAKDKLKHCLESIEKHTRDFNYSLTVVNNNSRDGTSQFLKNYKQKKIKIIGNNKNLGFCGAANIALRNTSNKFIVFLDDDAEVTEGWLDGLYKQIKNKPKVGIVSCKIVFPNNRLFSAVWGSKSLSFVDYDKIDKALVGIDEIDRGQRDYIKECDAVIGTCWLMRRELIDKIGYFDERFFPSQGEDTDYCLRTRLVGYKIIYNGKVKIIHHHLFRDGKQSRKNQRKFFKKWEKLLPKFPLKDSHPADKYMAKGADYLGKERFKQALNQLKKAESIDKRFSEPLYMGLALEGMGKYNDAIQQFKKVLSVEPSNILAHYNLASIYKSIGLFKKAKKESLKTLALLSSNNGKE